MTMNTHAQSSKRTLLTRRGTIHFPTFIAVTTYGTKYPLDDLVRPYLPRLAQAAMVSHFYARKRSVEPRLPQFIDSGGFVSLFDRARIVEENGLGIIELDTEEGTERITPFDVLDFQEQAADVAFTLDFPIPPGRGAEDAALRQRLTIRNALWAVANRRRRDLPLYACVQGWDVDSYRYCARALAAQGFDGLAIGGLVPRARDEDLVLQVVRTIRAEHPHLCLHVFGLGRPQLLQKLFALGVDSVDSSAYVKLAADGKFWSAPDYRLPTATPMQRMHLALSNLAAAAGAALPLSLTTPSFATRSLLPQDHHAASLAVPAIR
jgi:queuine/archaeosine tRNA-ribosyltransferase